MAAQQYRIVSGADSTIHGEPHVEGSRITVRDIQQRVEERDLAPERVAERYDLDLGVLYEALAYYHANPEEMREAEERHDWAVSEAINRSTI